MEAVSACDPVLGQHVSSDICILFLYNRYTCNKLMTAWLCVTMCLLPFKGVRIQYADFVRQPAPMLTGKQWPARDPAEQRRRRCRKAAGPWAGRAAGPVGAAHAKCGQLAGSLCCILAAERGFTGLSRLVCLESFY